jgi:origin recognition complex subunit 3
MCHFYANPLSILIDQTQSFESIQKLISPAHLEAVRMLPSFQILVEVLVANQDFSLAKALLEDDKILLKEMKNSFNSRHHQITQILRSLHIITKASSEHVETIDLYTKAFQGTLGESNIVRDILDSVQIERPETLATFIGRIREAIELGCAELDLDGWANDEADCLTELASVQDEVEYLVTESASTGIPIRSSYSAHSKALRTTVVSQRIQLSYEKSRLSKEDVAYTALVDRLSAVLKQCFVFPNPNNIFMNEAWLFDSLSPYKDVFTPRPRFTVEEALSSPQVYLNSCEVPSEALASNRPATTILYQMYLESGNVINIYDLWTAFYNTVGGEDGEGYNERTALMLFQRGLADLKLLGMIKQSKRKVDHLAKSSWRGL